MDELYYQLGYRYAVLIDYKTPAVWVTSALWHHWFPIKINLIGTSISNPVAIDEIII